MADIKKIAPTSPIINPMHRYASWSYCWSLWWLDPQDLAELMNVKDVDEALAWKPKYKTYVVAEDSGLYPDRRFPGTLPLNYNIQSVDFITTVGPTRQTRSSNMITGHMTIAEPMGVTLLDQFVAMSYDGTIYRNYTQTPFMLQCDFRGWDDKGAPIPENEVSLYRKRFPIKLLNIKIDVAKAITTYTVDYTAYGHHAHHPESAVTPKQLTVTAGTVEEFFNGKDGLVVQLNKHLADEVPTAAEYADQFSPFDIDPSIRQSSIVDADRVSLADINPSVDDIERTKTTFKIPPKTAIVDIITKVMAHSSFLIKEQEVGACTPETVKTGQTILNAFKTVVSTTTEGYKNGERRSGAFDRKRNLLPVRYSYRIHQYPSFDGKHPSSNNQLVDTNAYTVKSYNYMYTGQNIDIIDLAIKFDSTYYTAVMAYNTVEAQTRHTAASAKTGSDPARPAIPVNPAIRYNTEPNITPWRYRANAVDQNKTSAMQISTRPDAIAAHDYIDSLYTSLSGGDMVALTMTIVGDPTLIRQDDWLYVPSPNRSTQYNSWGDVGQSEFAVKYGHIRMDAGEVVVRIVINTPVDIDTEPLYGQTGLAYPIMTGVNSYQSLFSGQYKLITINNKFNNGKFEQELSLVRYINSSLIAAAKKDNNTGRDAVSTNQNNSTSTAELNPNLVGARFEGNDGRNANGEAEEFVIPANNERIDPFANTKSFGAAPLDANGNPMKEAE